MMRPASSPGPLVGFVCEWDSPPEPTWSYTPWNLRSALIEQAPVVDLGVEWSRAARFGLKALGAYRNDGQWSSRWRHMPLTQRLVQRKIRHAEQAHRPDVVLQMGDVATVETPFLLYQDLSFDFLLDHFDDDEGRSPHFPGLTFSDLHRLAERQRDIYTRAAGIVTMSTCLAEHLVKVSGVNSSRVFVVQPGANCFPDEQQRQTVRQGPRTRLLFVGKDFRVKGGHQLIAALALLRHDFNPNIELTVVGPRRWPMVGPVPMPLS